jgi:hypothetical protein
MKNAILLLVTLAVAAYAQYYPQGSVTPTLLTAGVTTSGTLPPNDNLPYYVVPYAVWIPANASYVNVSVTNTDSNSCTYVSYYFRTDGAACSYSAIDDDYFYCGNSYYDYAFSTDTVEFLPGYRNNLVEFKTGDYFYISIGLYSNYDVACTYNVLVNVDMNCPANTISASAALSSSATSAVCVPYTTVPNTGSTTYNITGGGSTDAFSVYITDVLLDTGMITVTANLTDSSVDIYGNQYSPYGDTGYYKCYESSGSSQGNGYYTYVVNCYTPRTGRFVWTVQETDSFNGTITFAFTQCSGGMGGYNCSFPQQAFNVTALSTPMMVTVPYGSSGWLSYYMKIFYVDVGANFTSPDLIFYFCSAQSSYLQVRIGGYPEYYSYYGYEDTDEGQSIGSCSSPAIWGLTQFDYVYPARYYFAILCTSSSAGECNVTISLNSTGGGSTSTGLSTTGTPAQTTTAGVSTTAMASTTSIASTTSVASTTRAATTAVRMTTAAPPVATTGAVATGGVEYLIPSFVLLLVSLLI